MHHPEILAHSARRVMSATAMAVVFAGVAVQPAIAKPTKSPKPVERACTDVTLRELKIVDRLLRQPENPALYAERTGGGGKGGADTIEQEVTEVEVIRRNAQAFRDRVEQRYGQTTHDASPLVEQLYEYMGRPNVPGATYLYLARLHMKKYGVKISVPRSGRKLDSGVEPLSPAELESTTFKANIITMLQSYDDMPEAYVEETGLTQITLANLQKTRLQGFVSGKNYSQMSVNAAVYLKPELYDHEMAHQLSHSQAKEACVTTDFRQNDTAFTKHNGDANRSLFYGYDYGEYGLDPNPAHVSYADLEAEKSANGSTVFEALNSGNIAAACGIYAKERALAKEVISADDYHPNEEEDRAGIGAIVSDPEQYYKANNPHLSPRFYRKFRLLVTRLYRQNPNLVRYFTSLKQNRRPDPHEQSCGS